MTDNTITHFVVLFTAQKTKKFKTWQDGTMKYYSSNKKLVLTDEKGYNIDRKFCKTGTPSEGDELEFDGHIVTIESLESTENVQTIVMPTPPVRTTPLPPPAPIVQPVIRSPSLSAQFKSPTTAPKKSKKRIIQKDDEEDDDDLRDHVKMEICEPVNAPVTPQQPTIPVDISASLTPIPSTPHLEQHTLIPQPDPQPHVPLKRTAPPVSPQQATLSSLQKRVRVGLSKRTASTLHKSTHGEALKMQVPPVNAAPPPQSMSKPTKNTSFTPASKIPQDQSIPSTSNNTATSSFSPASKVASESTEMTTKPFKSPFSDSVSLTLQFPNSKKALQVLKSKKNPKRSRTVPIKFANINAYKEAFKKMIHEQLDILLMQYAVYFYTMYERMGKGKSGMELERLLRSKGIGLYVQCDIKGDQRFEKRIRLMINKSREHYSKYKKDDIWVLSRVASFESSQTFLAKSTYFGPFSDGALELDCVSPRDVRIAMTAISERKPVYAIRTIPAGTEFMMLDTLEGPLDHLPMLPYLLQKPNPKKAPLLPLPIMEHIKLTRQDNIDVESKLRETATMYHLNEDQENVLRRVAKSVIACPGWNETTTDPVVLVHGVYGSGKSFLAAVIIIFIQEIVDIMNTRREPEERTSFNILVSSMTNVAVDRILQTLLKLGYDHFIRIGSMKKIAKNLLPYTCKARINSNEELKELEQMLDDPRNSEDDVDNISTAIQRFRKSEKTTQIQNVAVVGTTFMSSTFDVFNDIKFPLVLVDESSQLMEPLTMVPLSRFVSQRLIMIGDPLQLPPTMTTNAEEDKVGKGLDKTLFDRMIEMGHESVMLRTQYRCHPRISNISNKLFYDRRLLNGVTTEDRKPLIKGLPTLLFVDVGGTELRSMKSNSFWNDTEIAISAQIIQAMISLNVPPLDLGVISLYKEQADRLSDHLNTGSTESGSGNKSIQISTVDAFQGGEKEVIILSTVRTTESQFMDNQPRINVALTRAKRHLIILGNKNLFTMNELWSQILWECEEHCMNGSNLERFMSTLTI